MTIPQAKKVTVPTYMAIFTTLMNVTCAFKKKSMTFDNDGEINEFLFLMNVENSIISNTIDVFNSYTGDDSVEKYISELTGYKKINDENIRNMLDALNNGVSDA